MTYVLEQTGMGGRILVHAVNRRPDLVTELVQLIDIARIEGCGRLDEHTGVESTASEENGDVDVGVLQQNPFLQAVSDPAVHKVKHI